MPPRRRKHLPRRLAADLRAPASANDPTAGYGYSGWNQPSKPLTAAQKTELIGAVGTQIFAGLIAANQYSIPEPEEWQGENRWRTIAHMERDGQATAVLNVCVLPLLQATYSLEPGSEADADVQIAQDVADNLLHGMQGGWHFFLRTFWRNRFRYGHYAGEKVWTVNPDGTVMLRKIAERPPYTIYRYFPNDDDELDRLMQRVWIMDESGVTGQWKFPIISAEKLLLSVRNQEANDYRGTSLYYPMWEHWDFKHKLYLIDGIAAERNGMGVPDLEEPPIVRQQSDRDIAAAALEAFRVGETAYMLRPNGYKFSLTGVSGNVRDIMPSIQHHDLLMARSALAHFINLDAYGQLTVSADAQTLFLSAEEADGNQGSDDLDAVIREWVDYNYENVERYPTVAITGIGSRNLDSALRGIAALATAKLLTPNVETENALRDDMDLPALPAEPTAVGGGAPSVDPDSQGQQALAPDAAPSATPALPGTTAQQNLAYRPPFSVGKLGPRAIHLSGKPLGKRSFTLHMSGAYRDSGAFVSEDGAWLCLRRKAGGRHSVPDPNRAGLDDFDATDAAIRGFTHVLWRLGDGGVSGTHCPQCVKMAGKGLMALSELHIQPGSDDTYCGDACSCELEYRRARTVKVGQ